MSYFHQQPLRVLRRTVVLYKRAQIHSRFSQLFQQRRRCFSSVALTDVYEMPSEKSIYYPDPTIARNAYVSTFNQYKELYQRSLDNPEEFWGEIAKQFHWETPANHDRFFDYNFDVTKGPIFTKWLDGATTNISYNLLDRNVRNGNGDKVAFYW